MEDEGSKKKMKKITKLDFGLHRVFYTGHDDLYHAQLGASSRPLDLDHVGESAFDTCHYW
jgi:hypothetical protein